MNLTEAGYASLVEVATELQANVDPAREIGQWRRQRAADEREPSGDSSL